MRFSGIDNMISEYEKERSYLAEVQDGLYTKEEIANNIDWVNDKLDAINFELNSLEDAISRMERAEILQDGKSMMKLTEEYGPMYQVKDHYNSLSRIKSQFEDVLEALEKSISGKKNFDKTICFSNIRELLKRDPNVKIGQIEKEAGIRLGYLSRLEKETNTAEPSMEFIVTAAKLLDVSIDTLVSINLSGLTPHEQYLVKFFDKLKANTIADKLDWKTERPDVLKDVYIFQGESEHPLFNPIGSSYTEGSRCIFQSKSFGDNTLIRDDCYNLRLKNGTTLYLMNIEKAACKANDPDANAIEAWIWVPYKSVSVLFTSRDASPIAHILEDLYRTVRSQMDHPRINKDAMYAIEAFMKDDLEDDKTNDEDDIPF